MLSHITSLFLHISTTPFASENTRIIFLITQPFTLYTPISWNLCQMLICCEAMKTWASTISSWVSRELSGSRSCFVFKLLKKFSVALITCIFALGKSRVDGFTVQFLFFKCAHHLIDEIPLLRNRFMIGIPRSCFKEVSSICANLLLQFVGRSIFSFFDGA